MDNSWRSNLSHGSRDKIVNRILVYLQRNMPSSPGQDGFNERLRVARRFEEKVFQVANDQNDYLHKISLKMMTLETMSKGTSPPIITGASSTNLGEIEVENVVVSPPIPFVEVVGPDWKTKRFVEGTRAGFVVDRFNKLNPRDTAPVVCIQAHKEGEEPIEYGPEVELKVLSDKSWTLQTVSECTTLQQDTESFDWSFYSFLALNRCRRFFRAMYVSFLMVATLGHNNRRFSNH